MGFDSEDGKGERVILGQPGSYVKPLITPRGDRIVYSTRVKPGPAEVFIINWDGSGRQKLGDGFALGLWRNPADGGEWVYVGTENKEWEFRTISRFRIDAPDKREVVWNTIPVSIDNFQVSADGRYAGGMFPWPDAAMADLQNRTLKKFGQGCWGALTDARGRLFWYFDGAHRNLTMVDVETEARWIVNINNAPGFDGRRGRLSPVDEPSALFRDSRSLQSGRSESGTHRRTANGGLSRPLHRGFLARRGMGARHDQRPRRFLSRRVDRRRTQRTCATAARSDRAAPRSPSHLFGEPAPGRQQRAPRHGADASRLVVNARLTRTVAIPDPKAILPYRNALIVNEYEIMDLIQGKYPPKEIRIAQWAIRNSRIIPEAKKIPGAAFTLVVERYDAHGELEGERLISSSESSSLPLYYDVSTR